MAAESVGMSQKKKDRAATIGMIIFFSILAILTVDVYKRQHPDSVNRFFCVYLCLKISGQLVCRILR